MSIYSENMFSILLSVVSTEWERMQSPDINGESSDNELETKRVEHLSGKKQSRKLNVLLHTMTYEEIKALSMKSLVKNFSELTSNEMNKKYSYRCQLLPEECNEIFMSFGNEKKALDKIKSHLKSHLIELENNPNCRFVAKTPPLETNQESSNFIQKYPKKAAKKAASVSATSSAESYSKKSATAKYSRKHNCSAKKQLKFGVKNVRSISELSRRIKKQKHKRAPKKVKATRSSTQASTAMQSSIAECLPNFNNLWKTELFLDMPNSLLDSRDGSFVSDNGSSFDRMSSASKTTDENSAVAECLLDHAYAAPRGVKVEKFPCEYIEPTPLVERKGVEPQYIINSPPFPFVLIPYFFEATEVIEIDADGNQIKRLPYVSSDHSDNSGKPSLGKGSKKAGKKGQKSSKKQGVKQDVTGLVLECVENRVDMKSSAACAPRSSYNHFPENNVENMDNNQKFRREKAMKLIAKLSTKKKKQYEGPLECQICQDKHFTALATLLNHYRSHAGIKPFNCNICDATFTRQHSLNYHMLIHQNKSRFTCETCKRNFRHPSHYKEHLRRHTGEEPYGCIDCEQSFKTRNTYKRHMKTQHNKLLTAQGITDIDDSELSTTDKEC